MSISCGDGEFTVIRCTPDLTKAERKPPQRAADRRREHIANLAKMPAHSKRAWQIHARKLFE